MKLIQLFNSSVVSGPENLTLQNLAPSGWDWELWNLEETRVGLRSGLQLKDLCAQLGVTYRGFAVRSRHDFGAIRELREALDHEKPGLVHAHDVKASSYLAWTRYDEAPWVSTHHGVRGRPDFKSRLLELFYRRVVLKNFEQVIAVSAEDEKILRKNLGARVALLRNALPTPPQGAGLPSKENLRKSWSERFSWASSASENLWAGFVGRLSAEKDPLFALEIADKMPSLNLLFFGDGILRARLESEIATRGLGGRVACLGYDSHMAQSYEGLDAVLSVSSAEGLPLNLLECGGRGVPFLAKAVGGIPEISLGEALRNTLMSPSSSPSDFAARLESWRKHPLERRRLGEALRARVASDFSGTTWLANLASLYAKLGFKLSS